MSLQDLKGHFESDKMKFNDIQRDALRKRERDMIDEVSNLKNEREMITMKKRNDEHVMLDLVGDL